MRTEDISRLFEKFKAGIAEGKDPYFDAEEIEDLLDGISDEDAEEYSYQILNLGLKLHPDNQALLIKQVEIECMEGNFEDALKYADEIGCIDDPVLHTSRLQCYCFMKEFYKVSDYLDQLEKDENENLEEIYETLAIALEDNDLSVEGINIAKRGLKLFPDNLHLKESLLFIYNDTDKNKQAIALANELIDINPYSYKTWFILGTVYTKTSDYEKAIEALDFALTCKESESEAKVMKAFCLMKNESYEKAIETYLEINRESPMEITQPLLANCYLEAEQFEKAYTLLKSMLEVYGDRNDTSIFSGFIHSCAQTNRDYEAIEAIRLKAERYPEVPEFSFIKMMYDTLFESKVKKSNYDNEINELRVKFGRTQSKYEFLLFRAGYEYFNDGESEAAAKFLETLEKINPEYQLIHPLLVKIYLETGNKAKFLKHASYIRKNDLNELFQTKDWNEFLVQYKDKTDYPKLLSKRYLKKKDNSN